MAKINVRGDSQILNKLGRFISSKDSALVTNMSQGAKQVMDRSVLPITPRLTGDMRNSSFVSSEKRRNKITVRFGFDEEYAPYVHEMPETNNFTTPGTGPKFLQRGVMGAIDRIRSLIAKVLKV